MSELGFLWPLPGGVPRLAPAGVHVWSLALDLPAARVAQLHASLSSDEVERAGRYHFERHRCRFVACRGQVRQILAGYLGARPAELRFRYGPRGKPALELPWSESAIRFNVSNSDDVALLAVAIDRELGVDIEHLREPRDFDSLAAQFFAASEVTQLRSLPREQRLEGFFRLWTRKEAVLKAVGTGLAFPLDKIVVTLDANEAARVVAYDDDPVAGSQWWLLNLAPVPQYIAALAVLGSPMDVQCWRSML